MILGWNSLRAVFLSIAGQVALSAADPDFSGTQPGEPITPFKVLALSGSNTGTERDPITENAGAPIALVFVHTIERSLVPLLRVIDEYSATQSNTLRTELIFLASDRLEGERKTKAAASSLKLSSRVGLALDGPEGPGNYGLNKDCLMTILTARTNRTLASFALVQPGIADAPKVLAALATAAGDLHPPSVEALSKRHAERTGSGLARGNPMGTNSTRTASKPKENFPGAVPTDPKLQGLLRSFIRPTNDDATVDRLLAEVKTYIQDSSDLKKQALDGWTRVLHFGDRYGTPHSRKVGAELLEQLKRDAP